MSTGITYLIVTADRKPHLEGKSVERYTRNLDGTSETWEGCWDEDGVAGINNLDLD